MNESYAEKAHDRFTAIEAEHTRVRIARCPETQAEAIAKHYLAHFNTARDLLDLVHMRQHGANSADCDAIIARLTREIQDAHRHDLGIELEWSTRIRPAAEPFVSSLCGLNKSRELAGDAAFAAAVAAGVPVECSRDGDKFVMKLAQPVSVFVDGGEIKVFTRPAA